MAKAMMVFIDDPETQQINIECRTEVEYDPMIPSHAIVRYIGDHLMEIIQLAKDARTRGELAVRSPEMEAALDKLRTSDPLLDGKSH